MIMMEEYTKPVMYNAMLTSHRLMPSQSPNQLSPVLLFSTMPDGLEYSLDQLGSAVMAMSPTCFPCASPV